MFGRREQRLLVPVHAEPAQRQGPGQAGARARARPDSGDSYDRARSRDHGPVHQGGVLESVRGHRSNFYVILGKMQTRFYGHVAVEESLKTCHKSNSIILIKVYLRAQSFIYRFMTVQVSYVTIWIFVCESVIEGYCFLFNFKPNV